MRRAALLLLVAALAGCGGGEDESATATTADGEVRELENLLALRSDFEADAGKPRVLLLLSPT